MGSGANGGGGVKTEFDKMSHDDLWAWLRPSSSGTVQGVSDRLSEASTALEKLATDLTKHMEKVGWQGEAGDSFRDWGADTALSTKYLAEYSRQSSKWLALASQAIAAAHTAMPDSLGTAQASADAARKFHNDPDSGPIGASARSTITQFQPPPDEKGKVSPEAMALAATARENARQEAIQNMRNLAGSYSTSAEAMNGLQVPTFPAPPDRFVPEAPKSRTGDQQSSVGTSDRSSRTTAVGDGVHTTSTDPSQNQAVGHVEQTDKPGRVPPERPTNLGIDSVNTLPPKTELPPTTSIVPPMAKPEGPGTVPPGVIPPAFGGNPPVPATSAPGKAIAGGRGVLPPSQGGIASRMPRENGISGGRPVAPNTGRPAGGIPRGTVIGNEGTTGTRGPMGRGMGGMHGGGPMGGAGQSGISGGRRLASEMGGVVGGRPQQPGQTGGRPFTPGGSGLVRGQNAGGGGAHPGQAGRSGAMSAGTHGANSRRDDRNGERPDYLSEDEATWQQGTRPVVPPVID